MGDGTTAMLGLYPRCYWVTERYMAPEARRQCGAQTEVFSVYAWCFWSS